MRLIPSYRSTSLRLQTYRPEEAIVITVPVPVHAAIKYRYAKTVLRRERFRLVPGAKMGDAGRTVVDDGVRGFTWNLGTW